MKQSQAISAFSALAQDTRLDIMRALVKAGEDGLPSGVLAEIIGVSPASMSFHLGQLERAALVSSRRRSRSIIYSASYDELGALIKFLMKDCCANSARVRACC